MRRLNTRLVAATFVIMSFSAATDAAVLTTDAMYIGPDASLAPPPFPLPTVSVSDPKTAGGGFIQSEVTGFGSASSDFSGDGYARASNSDGITAVDANGVFAFGLNGVMPGGSPPRATFSAAAGFSDTVVNTSGASQDFFYDFTVFGPKLELADFAFVGLGPGEIVASYLVEIRVGGSSVWSSAATLRGGRDGFDLAETGVDLGGTPFGDPLTDTNFGFAFNDFSTSVFLGTLMSGASLDYEALIRASVRAPGFETGGRASIGDPGVVGGSGLRGTVRGVGAGVVPAPETTGLVLLGLLSVAGRRRRRSGSRIGTGR